MVVALGLRAFAAVTLNPGPLAPRASRLPRPLRRLRGQFCTAGDPQLPSEHRLPEAASSPGQRDTSDLPTPQEREIHPARREPRTGRIQPTRWQVRPWEDVDGAPPPGRSRELELTLWPGPALPADSGAFSGCAPAADFKATSGPNPGDVRGQPWGPRTVGDIVSKASLPGCPPV